jgi:hypothetical protein
MNGNPYVTWSSCVTRKIRRKIFPFFASKNRDFGRLYIENNGTSELLTRDKTMDDQEDFGDCIECRELLRRIDADLAEYERELKERQPSLRTQLAAGAAVAASALAMIVWIG